MVVKEDVAREKLVGLLCKDVVEESTANSTTTTSTSRNSSRRQDRFPVADEKRWSIHCLAPDRDADGDEEKDADDPSVSVPGSYGVGFLFFSGSILRGLVIASSFFFWFLV